MSAASATAITPGPAYTGFEWTPPPVAAGTALPFTRLGAVLSAQYRSPECLDFGIVQADGGAKTPPNDLRIPCMPLLTIVLPQAQAWVALYVRSPDPTPATITVTGVNAGGTAITTVDVTSSNWTPVVFNTTDHQPAITSVTVAAWGNILLDDLAFSPYSPQPDTQITNSPPLATADTSARFSFEGNWSGTWFQCMLDGQAWGQCVSPVDYSGLQAGNHTFQVRAIDWYGISDSSPSVYTWHVGAVSPPTVATGSASSVSRTGATVGGTVNPNGVSVSDCHFEWGATSGYGHTLACAQAVGSGNSAVAVSAVLSGLVANTTYHFRVVATNAGGTGAGADRTFQTPPNPPAVSTGSASSLSGTGATVGGTVNPNGVSVSDCHFEWGATSGYGHTLACAQVVGSGTGAVAVSAVLSGLAAGSTYHFRLVATNAGGTTAGEDRVLTTVSPAVVPPPAVPVVGTGGASSVLSTGATVGGWVNPQGSAVTECHFDWGLTVAYGRSAACGQAVGAGASPVAVSAALAGLTADTTYHFRLAVGTAGGMVFGRDEVFATSASPLGVVRRAAVVVVGCSPGSVAGGGSASCRVTVSDVSPGGSVTPQGTVAFASDRGGRFVDRPSCRLSGAGGSASCSVSYELDRSASGTYTIAATYGGDAAFAAGKGSTSVAALPAAGVAANVAVVSGSVLIKSSAGGSFVPLQGATVSVPEGSTIDARKGVIRLATPADYRTVSDPRHRLQVGMFSAAIFMVKQLTARQELARLRAQHKHARLTGIPSTDLMLITPPGALHKARCRRSGPPGKGVVRTLSGIGKGLYRTFGMASVTTIRNADWTVTDRCDGTLTRVRRGRATITTKTQHPHSVTISAGEIALIKARYL